ncbi:MAG TPA: phosphate acetyltransferase [Clostridiales bacterium]|nr:MAG: phosphate acetyltransferase [Clostridiales bacterium GWD2_32_59]HAN09923.1 phosphate acetyltransferase [Clostridiales bacterium]
MSFFEEIKEKAKQNKKVIVLPEAYDRRILEATEMLLKEDIADIILIGNPDEIAKNADGLDIKKARIIDNNNFEHIDEYINTLVEIRRSKGMTEDEARNTLKDPVYFGVMLVKQGEADGMVSGAIHSSADTLRPALQILKTAPETKLVSAFFIMDVPNSEYGANGKFVFADCGLNPNPTADELAEIAYSSSKSFEYLVGEKANIAMLSFSTKGSASHTDVDKVVQATKIANERYPDLNLDGELQLDAALVDNVAKLKAPDSKVAGKANVLVFPNLDAGNIGYKLVQRLAKAEAYGPITQGIAKPVNDLSRGCSAMDVVGVVAITAVQCQQD